MADEIEEMMQIRKKEKKRTKKKGQREIRKKEERKKKRKKKERQRGLNILKNYRVTMKIRNRKAKKHCEENVIC